MSSRVTFPILALLLVLCSSTLYGQKSVPEPSDTPLSVEQQMNIEKANAELDKVAKEIAQTLSHPGFRGLVRSEIAKSKNRENIVELEGFLEKAGKQKKVPPGLAKLKENTKNAKSRINALKVWDREGFDLYFPVKEHLRKWGGDADLFVAYAPYTDEDQVVELYAYSVKTGERYALDPTVPPDQPVLVVAPEEHETHEVPEQTTSERAAPPEPRGVETDNAPRKLETNSGSEEEGFQTRGDDVDYVKILFFRFANDKEPWYSGAPEMMIWYADAHRWYSTSGSTGIGVCTTGDYMSDVGDANAENRWHEIPASWGRYGRRFASNCSNQGVFYVYERDGGSYVSHISRIYEYSKTVSFKVHDGDDYVGGMYIYKSARAYGQDDAQYNGNIGIIWGKYYDD